MHPADQFAITALKPGPSTGGKAIRDCDVRLIAGAGLPYQDLFDLEQTSSDVLTALQSEVIELPALRDHPEEAKPVAHKTWQLIQPASRVRTINWPTTGR